MSTSAYKIPRNALALMLIGLAMVILPHVVRLPFWVTLLCVGCGFWRVMVYQGRWSFPGRWIKALFVFGGFSGIGVGYGTLLGLEPWVAMLILAFVLKLLEMHRRADAFTVIILAYFVALTEFLFEQSIPYALYTYACITVITAALIGLNQTQRDITPAKSIRKASLLLLQSIPLMLVLFILFPRISPLWSVPLQTDVARTGMSDTMSPGNIAELVQSPELAFRATFEGDIPSYSELYWRGLVLSSFDGETQTWSQERQGLYGRTLRNGEGRTAWADNMEYVGSPVSYSVIMEPTNRNWIFSLTLPESTDKSGMGLVRDFRFYSFREISSRFRYELTSWLDHRADVELSDFWRYRYTLLPEDDNPRTKQLAQQIRANSASPDDFLSKILRQYAQDDYAYTLRPPKVEGDTIDEFLFTSRRGFCEHFAGSFVYLMRAGGVPARVVVGYHGGEFNRRGNYVAVHQFDAHAWAEVWLEGQGWIRVDPTSVVAPERIERGLESAVESEETFLADVGLSLMKFRSTLWITELRLQISAMNHYWDAWVVGYNPSMQMSFLSRYFGEVDRKTLGMMLLGTFFTMLGLTALFLLLRRTRRPLPAAEKEYLRFCRLLESQNLGRRKGEGALDFARRVALARPDLAAGVDEVTAAYIQANFIDDLPEETHFLRKAVRSLRLQMLT